MGLFGRIYSLFYGTFAEETYSYQEPTNRSHPIVILSPVLVLICYAATLLALELHQNRIQVVRSTVGEGSPQNPDSIERHSCNGP